MQVGTIGLDLAKNIFQVHGIDVEGNAVTRKTLRRAHVLPFFAALPPCLIGIEAAKWSMPKDRENPFRVVRKTRETDWNPTRGLHQGQRPSTPPT